ncbi:MAG: hypothetical protein R2744_03955 [Bacteroidales bacterium]
MKGVYGVITTHYTNLKHFASSADGIVNGAMMFDNHLMQPLFRLDIGKPGSSFAFEIARKIGLPEEILAVASDKIGEDHINFDRHLKDILRDKRYWEGKRQEIRSRSKKLDEMAEKYDIEISRIKDERKEIIEKAKEEASSLLKEANRQIENTIRQIKESNAAREKTLEARSELEKLKISISEESDEDAAIERKIEKLKAREKSKGVKIKKVRPANEKEGSEKQALNKPVEAGEMVIIDGTSTPGEVVKIEGRRATVIIGNVTTTADISLLRRLTREEKSRKRVQTANNRKLDWEITGRRSNFKSERDIRGMRAERGIAGCAGDGR